MRKFGKDYILPAKVRHIGIQRPKINNLASIQARRPFVFSAFVADDASKKEKYDQKIKFYFEQIKRKIKERKYLIEDSLMELDQQQQNIQNKVQMMQQAMEQTQDPQQQMQLKLQMDDLQIILPRIQTQIDRAKSELNEQELFSNEEIETIEEKLKYDFKDAKEEIGEKLLIGLRRVLGIERKSTMAFIDKAVTGKEYFYVDYIPGEKYPRFEQINDVKIYYPNDPNAEFTHHGKWVCIEEEYTYEQVIKEWGGKLSDKDKNDWRVCASFNYS